MMDTDLEYQMHVKQAGGIYSMVEQEMLKQMSHSVYYKFKSLHPNSPELYEFSQENVKRWLYHIEEAEKNKGFEKVQMNLSDIEAIRHLRRAKTFKDLGKRGDTYEYLARHFPGIQVYACGSQVRGDYMDSLDEFSMTHTKPARSKAGMRTDRLSDYDFWVNHGAMPTEPLPCYFDRYRGKFNEKEMIPIPIYYGDV